MGLGTEMAFGGIFAIMAPILSLIKLNDPYVNVAKPVVLTKAEFIDTNGAYYYQTGTVFNETDYENVHLGLTSDDCVIIYMALTATYVCTVVKSVCAADDKEATDDNPEKTD